MSKWTISRECSFLAACSAEPAQLRRRPHRDSRKVRLNGPALGGTTGVPLAGATIGAAGSFAPGALVSGTTFVVPPATAALVVAK